jgi:hypothetical protein
LPAVWLVYSDDQLWEERMRELNTLELEAVSGARVTAPAPGLPSTLLGIRLSKKDRIILAGIVAFLRPRPRPAE